MVRLTGVAGTGLVIGLVLLSGTTSALTVEAPVETQVAAAELAGIVRDQGGAVVPGASVTVTSARTHQSRRVISTAAGEFVVAGLMPGEYRLEVALDGFRPLSREGLHLATGQKAHVDVTLTVGDVTELVTVKADASMLRLQSASLGQVVDHDAIGQLPLNGRMFMTLAALAPGVALPANSQLPRINGGRPRANEYLFDGISVLQPEPGQIAYFPVIDAIEEFKIESNSPPAEFGRFNGGVVNLTTKAGGNVLHGDAFEFFRHESLNTRNFFASTASVKPKFSRNQFGGVLGGPIVKDRTFFFVDYQGQRQTIGRTMISTVPTVLQREGVFTEAVGGRVPTIYDPATTTAVDGGGGAFTRAPFPNNTIPAGRFDRAALGLLQHYPLPTSTGTANNYQRTGDERDVQDQWDVRLDHELGTARDHVFGRLSHFRDRLVPVTPLPDGSGVTLGTTGPQSTAAWSFASSHRRSWSDRILSELRIGETRRAIRRMAMPLPTILVAGYQQLGSPPNTASDSSTGVREIAHSLTWLKGRHTVKLGVDWRWQQLNVIQPPSPNGSFVFTSVFTELPGVANTGSPFASFLLGQVQQFSIDFQQRQIRNRARFQEYFAQDDWRLSNRWTLNAGLRYTLNFPSTEESNQAAFFNLRTERLEYAGQNGTPEAARRLHKLNFGPRLGLVGRVSEQTVVSAGYGLVWMDMAGITTPFTTPAFPFLQTVSQRTLDNLTPALVLADGATVAPLPLTPTAGLGQGVFAVDRELGSGYVQQWNVSVEREMTVHTTLEIAYVGSRGVHIGIPDTNLNQLTTDQLAMGTALLQHVPNPYAGVIPRSSSLGDPTIPRAQLLKPYPAYMTVSLYRNNVGTTAYRGLEVRLSRRLAHGLAYTLSYTRSKLTDDASAVFDASILTGPIANYPVADSFNRARERDYSTGDMPHVFVSSITWNLANWTLAALMTLQSGVPIPVTQATNFNSFAGFGSQRPDLVRDPELPAGQRTPSHWFDTAAFTMAPQFTLGTATRNPVRGPSYRDVDVALTRRLPIRGTRSAEIRGEVFNLFNTPALGVPAGILGAANFGTITSAGDPRVVQLALRILF